MIAVTRDKDMTGGSAAMSDDIIRERIAEYKWFVDVNFGNGIVARSTSWPDAPPHSRHMGVSKYEFILRRNLPDLQGKRVLELGCNCGLIAIHMARLGAAEVVGIDSERTWPRWKEQAEFVKAALEWRCRATYRTTYVDSDVSRLPSLDLGRFDVVMALNSLYYLTPNDIARVIRHASTIADGFLIQCNTGDQSHLGERPFPSFMERALRENGFPHTHVDAPWDHPRRGVLPTRYIRPVVVGRRTADPLV